MKTKLVYKSLTGIFLASVLIVSSLYAPKATAKENENAVINTESDAKLIGGKEEVIYANLADNGGVKEIYSVNRFEAAEAGILTDYGNYTSVLNLTGMEQVKLAGDKVSVPVNSGSFYYQGTMADNVLPWDFTVAYYIDGTRTDAKETAGKSGELEIKLSTRKNASVNPVFYDNYMLQISMTLDTEKCGNITAESGTVALAGKSKIITHTVMPGNDSDISVSASVRDFSMGGIEISAVPFSMSIDLPDTSDMVNEMSKLSDAVNELNNGVKDLVDGVESMDDGAEKLANGSLDFKNGIDELSGSSGQLTNASGQIFNALSNIAASLNNPSAATAMDTGGLSQLTGGLAQLSQGLNEISGGLKGLKSGFDQAYPALDAAVGSIPGYEISQDDINVLYANTSLEQHETLNRLTEFYAAGQTVKGTYAAVKQAFDAISSNLLVMSGSIDTISGSLTEISSQLGASLGGTDIAAQMQQLAAGLSALAENYGQFDKGLKEYTNGINELSAGYSELHSGVSAISAGVGEMYGGTKELYDGTSQLNDAVSDMPAMAESEIEKLMASYDTSAFEPISFTSEKNSDTSYVQFVFKAEGINPAEKAAAVEAEPKAESFWARLASLFK